MELQRVACWMIVILLVGTASAYNVTIYAKDMDTGENIKCFYAKLDDLLKVTDNESIVFEDVSEGDHELTVWADNYASSSYIITVDKDVSITTYLNPLQDTGIVAFKIIRCFQPVANITVKVYYQENLTNSGITDDMGCVAFRLNKLKQYTIDINNSEKVITIQPTENYYPIALKCNLTQGINITPANFTIQQGNYSWSLFTIATNISNKLTPTAQGILTGLVAWLVMSGLTSIGLNPIILGVVAIASMAVFGFTSWITVLLCVLYAISIYVLRGGIG